MLLFNGVLSTAQSKTARLVDPFFLIRYDADKVHFDPMPSSVKDHCPEMRDHYIKAWVYGHLNTQDAEYFVVDGYIKPGSDDAPGASAVPEGGYGFVIKLQPGTCTVETSPNVFFPAATQGRSQSPKMMLPEAILDALSADMLKRYSKAFGGKKIFLKSIQIKREELPPSLRSELEKFERMAGTDSK